MASRDAAVSRESPFPRRESEGAPLRPSPPRRVAVCGTRAVPTPLAAGPRPQSPGGGARHHSSRTGALACDGTTCGRADRGHVAEARLQVPRPLHASVPTRPQPRVGPARHADVRLGAGALADDRPGRHPFAEPGTSAPDRWRPDRARAVPRGASIPFGAGSRKCIGEHFGTVEALLALSTLCARRRLCPVPGAEVRPRPGTTLGTGPLPMLAHPLARG
ncbi:cytochrome P450 [Streptomyces sp. SCL15-4]|uniref:cytochrome P450 n=1 Tax=Streptomyces sp. SCL15-4 TaxID=2967221 RepID=UPI00296658CA|nr:cytochrome P450 [Streptomyces sp. SCL15-4]